MNGRTSRFRRSQDAPGSMTGHDWTFIPFAVPREKLAPLYILTMPSRALRTPEGGVSPVESYRHSPKIFLFQIEASGLEPFTLFRAASGFLTTIIINVVLAERLNVFIEARRDYLT
ncbi:hypothetical protein EVAR_18790_1 [Eumeta japonica]|uniref:Uncharacterized protein n=1 Tax=Eumeta variegata TaxID=151549 RepID=A0A4C1ULX2_EUMVA|nr:hypothetical protein EVAR_18790_1 [Eumeta japonica]